MTTFFRLLPFLIGFLPYLLTAQSYTEYLTQKGIEGNHYFELKDAFDEWLQNADPKEIKNYKYIPRE